MKPLGFYRYKRQPLDHQRFWFEKTRDEQYWGYAHDMGTGKTKIVFDRAQYLYRKKQIEGLLIIAPKGVHEDHITKELEKDLEDNLPYLAAYYSASASKLERKNIDRLFDPRIPGLRIIAFNTDSVRTKKGYALMVKFLDLFTTFFVVDESSDFSNDGTQRSKSLLSLAHKAKYRAWLDGTPINQGPLDLYVPCEFLKQGLLGFPTFASFKARYAQLANGSLQRDIDILVCQTRAKYKRKHQDNWEDHLTTEDLLRYQDELNISKQIYKANLADKYWSIDRLVQYLPDYLDSVAGALLVLLRRTPLFVVGYKNLDELKERIKPFTSRVELVDVVDMPDSEESNVYYDLPKKHREIYEKLKKDYLVEFEQGDIMSVDQAITLYGRLQQMLGGFYKSDDDRDRWISLPGDNARLEILIGILNRINFKYKVLIAARWVEEIKLLERTLKKQYGVDSTVTYFGENSDDDQRNAKDQIENNPDCRYFIMNPSSGSKGLNRLIVANYLINYSRLFSYAKEKQLFARIFRKGQEKSCFKINIIARNTMDDLVIAKAQDLKKDVADFITQDISKFI